MNRTVFISSTYEDLKDYRRKAWDVLRTFAADVRGMEEFGARKEAPLDTCLAEVDQCDVFVGIIGFRLGSVDPESGKSFTQLEYERAYEHHKEMRIYFLDDSTATVPPRFVDRGESHLRLDDFKHLLNGRHTVAVSVSPDDLAQRLDRDLRQLLTAREPQMADQGDEFAESAETIRKFLLVPRQYSGRQVRVVVQVHGDAFPASREICDAFQLPFGGTVGVSVSLQRPTGLRNAGLDEMYARGEQVPQLCVPSNSLLDVYADLQFSDRQVGRVTARFRSESGMYAFARAAAVNLNGPQFVHHEADSKIALLLSEVIAPQARGSERSHAPPANNGLNPTQADDA